MSTVNLTPDSAVLQQIDGQWQKFAMLILWKLNGRKKVTITADDMKQFGQCCQPGVPVMYVHGHSDSLDFQVVDMEAAEKLAAHDQTQKGTA